MSATLVVILGVFYISLLFFIAWQADRKSSFSRKWIHHPVTYALSMGVYCTAWTFFGSVGRAATDGFGFLPTYLGPTLVMITGWVVLRKIILISKTQRITSIADFISARYGKSIWLGIIATLVAIVSCIPYVALQLKAVSFCFDMLRGQAYQAQGTPESVLYLDSGFYIATAMAVFTILFGTRHLDPNERHEGLVAAIAFESLLKLIAFLTVGIYVCFFLFDGLGDIFRQANQVEAIAGQLHLENNSIQGWDWFFMTILSMSAILFLPRQFHISVVENTNPNHVSTASWLFPLYLLLINIFVLPIALGGELYFQQQNIDPDTFVLSLPLASGATTIAILVAIGGFSAATGMVMVSVLALSIMVSNNLVLPGLLRTRTITNQQVKDVSARLLGIRRISIIVLIILAYGFFRSVGNLYTLVSIGLISFAGAAQFAPVALGGIFWRGATKAGAISGLLMGALVWAFCLPLPTLCEAGIFPNSIMTEGLFGNALLKPHQLFGLEGLNAISHGTFWSLFFNGITFLGVSLFTQRSALEIAQADVFVNIYKYQKNAGEYDVRRRKAKTADIREIMVRFLGEVRSAVIMRSFEKKYNVDLSKTEMAPDALIQVAETQLGGSIGAGSAKIILNTIVKEDPISLEEMFRILEQTQEIVRYSHALEQKSAELRTATEELKTANERLLSLDRLKADFIATITHELRTPITSVKSLAKILQDNPDLAEDQRTQFLGIMVHESERIARLINQVLDLEKIGVMRQDQVFGVVDMSDILSTALKNLQPLTTEKNIEVRFPSPQHPHVVYGDEDALLQVAVNLISNAIKFCPDKGGIIQVRLGKSSPELVFFEVEDNGVGIAPENHRLIFEKFTQVSDHALGKPHGSGLGLSICKKIVENHNGRIEVDSRLGSGACFRVVLEVADGQPQHA